MSWSAQNPTIPSSQCAEKSEYRLRVVERKCISFTVYQAAEDPPSPVHTDGFLLNVDLAVYSTPIGRYSCTWTLALKCLNSTRQSQVSTAT